MKVSYDSTIDEAVNANFELARLTGTVRRHRWWGLLWVPILFLAVFCIVPRAAGEKAVAAAVMAVVFVIVHVAFCGVIIRSSFRRQLVKALGTADPVPAEYELDEKGLVFRKMGQELRLSWKTVVRVVDSPARLDVFTEPAGVALIPKRAFAGEDEARDWLEFIKGHMHES